jgi:hypothetical protein
MAGLLRILELDSQVKYPLNALYNKHVVSVAFPLSLYFSVYLVLKRAKRYIE